MQVEAHYFSGAAGHARITLGNRRWGENGYVAAGRLRARPVQNKPKGPTPSKVILLDRKVRACMKDGTLAQQAHPCTHLRATSQCIAYHTIMNDLQLPRTCHALHFNSMQHT